MELQNDDCNSLEPLRYGNPKEFPVVLLASHQGLGARIEWLTKLLEVASGIFCGSLSPQKVDKVSSRINQFMHDEKRDFLRHQMDDGTQLGKIVIHNFSWKMQFCFSDSNHWRI